jgi:quercetin 2,3-dioxygenase
MLIRRPGENRGRTQLDWLDSRHTFSFADYHDPAHMGFRALRVINEDRVRPGMGFGTHGHRDMEIITYVLEGALEHKDSLGTGSVIYPGDGQRMSAGTGILHSEYNYSATASVHFLQIWIMPGRAGLAPGYEQKAFPVEAKLGKLCLIAAPDGRHGAITVHQDVALYVAILEPGTQAVHRLLPERYAWVQVARGAVELNGVALQEGDGAAISAAEWLAIRAAEPAEMLLFDLA